MSYGLVFVCTALIELYVLRRLRFDWLTVTLVVSATVLSVDYATYTSIAERNYDGAAHVEYIQAMAQFGRPPDPYVCVACGHPPLYYALAALWSKLTLVVGFVPFELRMQWLSLLLFFGFVAIALVIFRSCGARLTTLRLAAALLVFWPSSIINSVRVHNDALASPLLLAAAYFIAQWDRQGRQRDFYSALAACALSLLTKATGYTVAATLLLFVALRLCTSGSRRAATIQSVSATTVLAAAAFLAVGSRAFTRPTTLCQKIFGHACDGRYVPPVADTPSRFLYFDVRQFLGRFDTLVADPAHDFFLNRLAKSSLFGVAPLGEEFASGRYAALAGVIGVLLLVMVAGCVLALPFVRGVEFRTYRTYVVMSAVMFVFLVAFRIAMPNEYHEDFRHIFPVLVPFCLGYAQVVSRLARFSKHLRAAGVGVALSMVASSVAFFARVSSEHRQVGPGSAIWLESRHCYRSVTAWAASRDVPRAWRRQWPRREMRTSTSASF
jgi:hypothetical protein